jgi:hypothetical protein
MLLLSGAVQAAMINESSRTVVTLLMRFFMGHTEQKRQDSYNSGNYIPSGNCIE